MSAIGRRLVAVLSIVAIRLLQMRQVSRTQPNLPASQAVPESWLRVLEILHNKPIQTVRDAIHQLAKLGGFLGRKRDGDPGWQTIWKGYTKLETTLRYDLALQKSG